MQYLASYQSLWSYYAVSIEMCSNLPVFFFFYQVLEFVAFKEKLQRSHQLMAARIESAILSLKQKANNLEEIEVIFLTRSF